MLAGPARSKITGFGAEIQQWLGDGLMYGAPYRQQGAEQVICDGILHLSRLLAGDIELWRVELG